MSETRRVLVVDDEPAVTDFIARAVQARGLGVARALDGQAALAEARNEQPAMVFLDALLPKVDGYKVLTEIRQLHPDVPVIMMSGIYKKRSYEDEARRLGARAFLHKPLKVLQVWELVERHLAPEPATAEPLGTASHSLTDKPLVKVVSGLHVERSTGLLFVRGEVGRAILFFEDGAITFARSTDPESRLDRVLVSTGRLSAEELERATALFQERRGGRFGEILVSEGFLTSADLSAAIADQVRAHASRPFTWTEGETSFLASDEPRQEPIKLTFDVPALVFWGSRYLPEESLPDHLPAAESQLRVSSELEALTKRLGITPPELEVLQLLDGTRELGTVRAIGRMAQVDVDRLVVGLRCLSLVDTGSAGVRPAAEPPRMLVPTGGDVASTRPAAVIVDMRNALQTGVLEFQGTESGQAIRRVAYFEEGRIAFASSNHPRDRLGQVLIDEKLVTPEQLEAALTDVRERPGLALGRALLDRKVIGLEDLHRALLAQVRRVLGALVQWTEGRFHFREGPLPSREIVPLSLPILRVMLEVLREHPVDEPALPVAETTVARPEHWLDVFSELKLTELEDRVFTELERPQRLEHLLSGHRDEAASCAAVRRLVIIGLLESHAVSHDAPDPASTGPALFVDEEFEDLSFGGSGDDDNDEVREELAGLAGEVTGDVSFSGLAEAVDAEEAIDASFSGLAESASAPDGEAELGTTGTGTHVPGLSDDAGEPAGPAIDPGTIPEHAFADLQAFFTALAQHLEANPGAVPEDVLKTIPSSLRELFEL